MQLGIVDLFFIVLYISSGIGVFVLVGKHFGPGYGLIGFVLGYLVAWGAKRLILRIVFSKTSSRICSRRNKKPASEAGKVDGQKQD